MTQDNAGASAWRQYQRLHDEREDRIDESFGPLAPVVKFLVRDPQSILAWGRGSAGERKLAACLEERVGDCAVLLHDRRIPRRWANVGHLVIAPSGVWVVDAKTYLGEVERFDRGRWRTPERLLYVGGRDRTDLVDGLTPQMDAVRVALEGVDVPLHATLCFVDAGWSMWLKPFMIGDVLVTPPRRLAWMIARPGPLSSDQVLDVAGRLDAALRPA